jgi:uncharacterized membrane protein required for colicin V production
MTLTLFDIVILTIISISSLFGLYKGMIQIVINFLGFIASIFATIFLYPKVKVVLSSYFNNDLIVSIASGVSSYIFSLVVFTFICSSLIMMVSVISQGFLDRLLGVVAGFVRGILISVILFWVATIFATGVYSKAKSVEDLVFNLSEDDYPEWLKTAMMTPYLESILKDGINFIPAGILSNIELPGSKDIDKDGIVEEIKKKAMEINPSADIHLDKNINDLSPAKE